MFLLERPFLGQFCFFFFFFDPIPLPAVISLTLAPKPHFLGADSPGGMILRGK